jgi:hypothetical protein
VYTYIKIKREAQSLRENKEVYTMTYKIITENGMVIAENLAEKAAEKFWDRLNGIWIDYDDNDKEYYIYIEAAN